MKNLLLQYSDCPAPLRDFLFYLGTIKGRSPRTVDGYYIDLRTFFRFIAFKKQLVSPTIVFEEIPINLVDLEIIKTITLSDAYEFFNYVSTVRENSPITRSRKASSIRSFFHYITNKMNLLENNPMLELEVPSIRKNLPKFLSLEQCFELLKSVDSKYYERDYCIITLFLNCGMRLSELVGLNLADIGDETLRLHGKGNKERMIYINKACRSALDAYLSYRQQHTINPAHKKALFLNKNGVRIGARRVEQIVDEGLKRAGLEQYGFSTHKLRHTAATIMYQNGGVDIRVLQEILGHANLGTTEIYTHTSSDQMKAAVNSTPLSKVKAGTKKATEKK